MKSIMKKMALTVSSVLLNSIAVLFAALMMAGCAAGNELSEDPHNPLIPASNEALEGKLLILQAYGTGDATDGAVSHSFVELYNNTDVAVNLSGYSLQYAAGTKVADNAAKDGKWQKIDLTGKTIQAGSSFLILGKKGTAASPQLSIADDSGDIIISDFELSNRALKVALIQSADLLTVQNPFNMDGAGGKAAGYVDMIGVTNDATDKILGYEATAPVIISKQKSARRASLTDTDNNLADFASIDYRTADVEKNKPRNQASGAWDPFEEPQEPGEQTQVGAQDELAGKLLILQAYGTGDATDGAVSHSFVELYNTTNAQVNLSGYSLQYADGTKVVEINTRQYFVPNSGTEEK